MSIPLSLFVSLLLSASGNHDPAQQSGTKAGEHQENKPVAIWEYPVEYEDADIIQFVTDDLLLIGAFSNDKEYLPVYGPLIMYDLRERSEKWRTERVRSMEAVHEIVSTSPLIILRTTLGSKVFYRAYDAITGEQQWKYDHKVESIFAFGASDDEGLADFYELSQSSLKKISARSGSLLWESKVTSEDKGDMRQLLVTPGFVYVVGSRHLTALDPRNGKRLWECSQDLTASFDAVVSLEGIFVYSAHQAFAYREGDGELLWNWEPKDGVIKLLTERANHIFGIIQHPEMNRDDIVVLDRESLREVWRTTLSGYVASPLLIDGGTVYATVGYLEEVIMGMVDNPVIKYVYTNRRDFIGLSGETGEMSLSVPIFSSLRDPGLWFYPPLLDRIDIRGQHLLLACDDYGVCAIDRSSGEIEWDQPNGNEPSPYSRGIQSVGLYSLDTKKSYEPGGPNSFTAPQPSHQYSMYQENNEANIAAANRVLNDPGASVGDRDAARLSKEIYTSAEMNRIQISSSFQRVQSSMDFAVSIMALGNFFEQVRQAQVALANERAVYNGQLDIKTGILQHNEELKDSYCLHAYPHHVTLIDLSNGKRCDLYTSRAGTQGHADKATAAISPGEHWLASVGISPDNNGTNSSLILYDISDLPFTAE